MQRYRVNYTLLVVLVVGLFVAVGSIYGIWSFQQSRNAGSLLDRVAKAEKDGDRRNALRFLNQYTKVRTDDREAQVRLANLAADIGTDFGAKDFHPNDFGMARSLMETTLRKFKDEDKLRRRLVDVMMPIPQFSNETLDHLNYLIDRRPEDTELRRMKALTLMRSGTPMAGINEAYKMIGYDPQNDVFDASKGTAPKEVPVYAMAASLLRSSERKPELADRLINQMVEANPDNVDAYIQRGIYKFGTGKENEEDGMADLLKAHEIDPKNVNVVAMLAQQNLSKAREETIKDVDPDLSEEAKAEAKKAAEDYFATAKKYIEEGLAADPQDARFYQQYAMWEIFQKRYDEGLTRIKEGLEKIKPESRGEMLLFRADLEVNQQDVAAARKTVKEMESERIRPEMLKFIEARCKLVEQDWFDALNTLTSIKPSFSPRPDLVVQIDTFIGLCYEKLGMHEKAGDAYRLAADADPNHQPARDGERRINLILDKSQANSSDNELNQAIMDELRKPEKEQNWTRINADIDRFIDERDLSESAGTLLKVEILMRRRKFEEARILLQTAYKKAPDDISVVRAAEKLIAADPGQGPEKALQFHEERVVKKFGDLPMLRMDKADLIIAKNDPDMKAQLMKLGEGMDEWEVPSQVFIWSNLGNRFLQLNMRDEAKEAMAKAMALAPNDLAARMRAFAIARDEKDNAGMEAAQKDILGIVGTKDDPNYVYTEAQRLVSQVLQGAAGIETLDQANQLVDKALQSRAGWNEPYLLRAEIALRKGEDGKALAAFEQAMKLGRPTPAAILQYSQLLVNRGRWSDALTALEKLDLGIRQRVAGRVYAQCLLNGNRREDALETADAVIENEPENELENAALHLWYGQFVLSANAGASKEEQDVAAEKAGKALEKAVQLSPSTAETWMAWVNYLIGTKQLEKAADAIRQLQLELAEDELPLVLARCYEATGRWFDAETLYRTAVDSRPDDVSSLRYLAGYYLGRGYPIEAQRRAKATPLINKIMNMGAEDTTPEKSVARSEAVLWARRTAAKLLAETRDYQNALKAEKLLASNAIDGVLSVQDKLQMAELLSSRPEPISRVKALNLLEDVKRYQDLNQLGEQILGQLYFLTGDWAKARIQMTRNAIAKYPTTSAGPRRAYIAMLLQRGTSADVDEARRQLSKLVELEPTSPTTLDLIAQVAIKSGKEQEALRALQQLLPRDLTQVKDESLPGLVHVAGLLTELKDYDSAERIHRFAAGKNPMYVLSLAEFLGTHREFEKGLELLDKAQGTLTPVALLQTKLKIVRARRDEVGDKYDENIKNQLDRELRDDPEAIVLNMLLAEYHDLRKEYDKAAEVDRKLLGFKTLVGSERAIILNNLAFLLALGGDKNATSDEPARLIDEAVQILGPVPDILDTRGVVAIARKEYDKAIADLKLSLTENPTASKYYHLAVAQLGAGNDEEAVKAWQAALDLGLNKDAINTLEYDQFEQMKTKVEALGLSSASL